MDLAALFAGRKHDLADQRAQRLGGWTSVLVVGERLGELLDPLAVESGDVGMQIGHIGGRQL
ncbi:hypothetical protein LCM4577_26775 [Mesorhizobium sp. LCM 4577]|nr:hypothetical protein LCM4577_26775 [Mesorhizobium sp. LCM 4577]